MRRLRGTLLTLASGLSLILCITTVMMWVRYRSLEVYATLWDLPLPKWAHAKSDGVASRDQLSISLTTGWHAPNENEPQSENLTPATTAFYFHGFAYYLFVERLFRGGVMKTHEVQVPWWFAITVPSALPICLLCRVLADRIKLRRGHCEKCGYDLRASPERCPECGEPVPDKSGVSV